MFKGVLFDLDGVITDTAEFHYRAWKKLGEEIGISIDRNFNEQLKGVSREDSLTLLLAYGKKENDFSNEEFAALAKRKNEYYLEMIQEITPADVFPGIVPLLTELKKAGIKIALASASKNGPLLLDKMQLTDYFDAIADPSKVASGKPAPDIFLLAAKEIGLEATDCLGIEDAKAGIQAIIASGAYPVGVGRKEDLGEDIPIVADTSSLTLDYLQHVWRKDV
ncbi:MULTISPECIES: beta-phosphoglucomutase [Enterococcus]|uniref:beta-phosphoglucomutase n=1 Tax=Enterococcus TaxID=1350 RepID=UPI0002F29300|nr:beta-phosphoglucomutase [Enterococcus mundtii]MBO1085585.1 beta-phosphoglucomutase [Enterococcus mundtii]MDB7102531.1 beta-phosphoglucomutase [Enterococcus mundtii]MDV7745865.1 beta-phosphoglucomutase [Enterococcus mundtii]